jgi:hypothetical protein
VGQSNLFLPFKKLSTGLLSPASLDSGTGMLLLSSSGGNTNSLNITAASVIKASPGRLARVIIVNPGTAGSFTFNDCLTAGAASAANTVWSVLFDGTGVAAGVTFAIDFPFNTGIVLSAVATGGVLAVSFI